MGWDRSCSRSTHGFGSCMDRERSDAAKERISYYRSIPMYRNGTANAGLHGSLFVAGEAGAEMVGHINGQTEVLNQSQIKLAMRSAVISRMAQFTSYLCLFMWIKSGKFSPTARKN